MELTWRLHMDLLLAEALVGEDGVLAGHAAVEGALHLCAQGQLAHIRRLVVAGDVALLDQALVLQAVEAGIPRLDVLRLGVGGRGVGQVRGRNRGCEGGRGAVGGHAGGGAIAGRLRFGSVSLRLRHGCGVV